MHGLMRGAAAHLVRVKEVVHDGLSLLPSCIPQDIHKSMKIKFFKISEQAYFDLF